MSLNKANTQGSTIMVKFQYKSAEILGAELSYDDLSSAELFSVERYGAELLYVEINSTKTPCTNMCRI